MVGTSKILTVSYGTFSCTLEGFDDSFGTMKAIAEYFRGLASEDRYFGAEPPTPDAEMLAKIAEREISRRVDARMDDGGIVLRASALSDQSAPRGDLIPDEAGDEPARDDDQSAEAEQAEAEAKAREKAERKAAKAARKAAKAQAKAEAKAAAEAEAEAEEAAKAQAEAKAEEEAKAEADAKAKAEAEAEADAKAAADAKAKADAEADAKAKAEADAEAKAEATPDTPPTPEDASDDDASLLSSVSAATAVTPEGTTGSDVEETRDTAPSSVLAAKDPAPDTTAADDASKPVVPAHPDADSVAAKLQRIRAVVGNTADTATDGNDGDDINDMDVVDLTSANLAAQFQPQIPQDVAEADDPLADFDAHEAEMEAAAGDDLEDVADDAAENAEASDVADATLAQNPSRIIRMKRSEFEAAQAATTAPEAAQAAQDTAPQSAEAPADTPAKGPDFGLLDGADDLDEYLEDDDATDIDLSFDDDVDLLGDFEDEDPAEDSEPAVAIASDDEDDTLSNVMGVLDRDTQSAPAEDDVAPQIEEDTLETPAEADPQAAAAPVEAPQETAHGFLNEEPRVDDAALDRLMSETDAQMQEPEGSRRRDAIAQLKAAVAAKEAARQVGEPEDDGADVENAFRNDLSEAVRPEGPAPRRIAAQTVRTDRPRPAPLKLVPAQRVDLQNKPVTRDGPVLPRRVAARPVEAQPHAAGSFAEFAQKAGATELPDLLEAAAAYTSFVEGADEFSRPQILRRVRAVASDDFNREDGLRSFAELLRAGRFTKVRNGRFQVAGDSRFNPESRAS